jgi:GDP-4-dehydro-6-deoxy-D-mannose reductase
LTGASGFVGRHLLRAVRQVFPETVLIAGGHSAQLDGVDISLALDLLDEQSIFDCLKDARADVVVNLAAAANVADSFDDPLRTWRANVDGTLSLALGILQAGSGCALIFASSAEIYGLTYQRGVALDEDAPLSPANPYAASKAAADIALGEMALRGLRVLRMRATNHTGVGQSDKFVVPAFARQLALIEAGRQEPVMQVGALDRWRDFIDVDDVCAAYVAAIQRREELPPGTAINIGSGKPRRTGDILDALIARTGLSVDVRTEAGRMRPTDVLTASCDPTRAHALLDWAPEIDWDQTLEKVLADWRGQVAGNAA